MPQMWPMLWEALFIMSIIMLIMQNNKISFNINETMINSTKTEKEMMKEKKMMW